MGTFIKERAFLVFRRVPGCKRRIVSR